MTCERPPSPPILLHFLSLPHLTSNFHLQYTFSLSSAAIIFLCLLFHSYSARLFELSSKPLAWPLMFPASLASAQSEHFVGICT